MSASSWQAVWLLAVEVAAVVGLTWLIAWRLRSVVWQRTLWQACLLALLGLLVMEFAALTPDFIRKEVQADTPVMEMKAEAMEVRTPENAPAEIAATELSIMVPAEPLVSLEPVAAMAPVSQEVVLTADRMTVIKETKAEEAAVKSSADKFPLGLALLLLVWTVGSLVLAGRLLVGRFLLLRFCARSRVVADERLFDRVQGIARKLGLKQGVQVLETERIQTPVVFGLFRLTIALPVGFAERFQRRQQEAILAHELAHLAARDPLWYLLADALVSVLWWHPLVWVARARLQVTSELAADEACVLAKHGPETLAECLVSIAQEMHGQGALESIGIEGSGFRSRLGQRVERLLQLSAEAVSQPAVWRTRLVKVGMPVLLVAVLLVGSGWVRRDQSAPWSGLMSGAWNMMAGVLKVEEVDTRREPRPVLMVAQAEKSTVERVGGAEKVLEPLVSQVFTLKHAVPTEIVAAVGTAISDSRGKILADDQAKKLLVTVVQGDMKPVEDIVRRMDVARDEGAKSKKAANLDAIKLPQMSLRNVTLGDAVSRLNQVLQNGPDKGVTLDWGSRMKTAIGEINLNLVTCSAEIREGASLREALELICKGAVYALEYQEKGDRVVFQPRQPEVAKADPAKGGKLEAVQQVKLEKVEISKLVSDAKQLYEQNRLGAAEDKLKEALKHDPANSAAYYYLNLVQEARYGDLARVRGTNGPQLLPNVTLPVRTNLYIRIGKVETNSFFKELEKKTGEKLDLKVEGDAGHYSYSSVNLHRLLQKYFAVGGLVCEVNGPDAGGTRVSFNPASGVLWVRGTTDEVELARKLVQPFLTETLPTPNPNARTNTALTGRQRNLVKLDQIVLKEVFFDDKPLSEVVMFLTEEARRLDPEKKGINFIINSNLAEQPGRSQVDSRGLTLTPVPNPSRGAVDLEKMRIKINPPLKNLRLVDALDAITKVATPPADGVGLRFMVEDYGVVFRQRVVDLSQLFTRVYKLDTNKLMSLLEKETEGKVAPLRTNVTASGQANVVWTVPTNKTIEPGDKISVMVRQYLAGRGVSLAAAEAGGVNTQIFFNERTGVLMVRCTRQDLEIIETALENLGAIEKVMPTPNPLGAAASAGTNTVSILVQDAKLLYELRRLDEAEKKLNEALKLDPKNPAAYYYMNLVGEARKGGLPLARQAEQRARIVEVEKEWEVPKARTEPSSVHGESDERITKVFKVDADSAVNGFREMMKTSGFASTNLQEMMREFIRKSGVNLSEGNTNGTVVFLNDRTGVLLARAKPAEMQIIESAIEVLNIIPPQVEIQAHYLVVPEKVAEEMGLKWFANGLPPDISKPVAAMQLAPTGSSSSRFNIQIDAPQVPNHVSILSPEQARELLKRLEDAAGVDRLSAPRVTTVNKRQAQISVMEAMTVVVGRTNRVVKGEAGKKDSEEPVFITEQLAMGPMLDVVPNVYPDGKSMRLDWVFSLTEFLGYEKLEKRSELPKPLARVRQVSNQNVIQDGYTLVAGCGMADIKTEAKKGLFRSGREKTEKKMVLILMKVNLLDPAGNYLNRE